MVSIVIVKISEKEKKVFNILKNYTFSKGKFAIERHSAAKAF